MPTTPTLAEVEEALRASWTRDTSDDVLGWIEDNPDGQAQRLDVPVQLPPA